MNPQEASGQLGNGVPGGFPLPQGGQQGTAYVSNKMHPAAIAALPAQSNPAAADAPSVTPSQAASTTR